MPTVLPKQIKAFTCSFQNEGEVDETLDVFWVNPDGSGGQQGFLVGTDILLDDVSEMSYVPDDQLLASVSMGAILSGEVLPGSAEFNDIMGTNQDTKNFQTIIGNAVLKSVTAVDTGDPNTDGRIYDLEFNKKGSVNNVKVVRADVWNISQYTNRSGNYALSAHAVPGAIKTEFGSYDKGNLDASKRQDIIDFVAGRRFWV